MHDFYFCNLNGFSGLSYSHAEIKESNLVHFIPVRHQFCVVITYCVCVTAESGSDSEEGSSKESEKSSSDSGKSSSASEKSSSGSESEQKKKKKTKRAPQKKTQPPAADRYADTTCL